MWIRCLIQILWNRSSFQTCSRQSLQNRCLAIVLISTYHLGDFRCDFQHGLDQKRRIDSSFMIRNLQSHQDHRERFNLDSVHWFMVS